MGLTYVLLWPKLFLNGDVYTGEEVGGYGEPTLNDKHGSGYGMGFGFGLTSLKGNGRGKGVHGLLSGDGMGCGEGSDTEGNGGVDR